MVETRQIVVPGEVVDDSGDYGPGMNTYQDGRVIYALRLGVKAVKGGRVSVISLSGRYEPQRGDMVIGTVAEVGPSNWYINIGAANDVGMHVNDVPWRVEFGETSKYLAVGDTVLLKIVHVDEMKKAQVSMKDRQCRKLSGGILFEVSPTKVPRIVGRNGSMISLIKDATHVRIFVGQNGIIWLDGDPDDVTLALEALRKIEAEAHTTGLTDRMKAWLEERRPLDQRPERVADEEDSYTRRSDDERPPRREERAERPERPERREPRGDRDDRPRRGRDEFAKKYRGDEDEEEERPRRRPFEDEESAEAPPRRPPLRRVADDDEEEDAPRRRTRADEGEEEEDRPARRFGDERPREHRGGGGGERGGDGGGGRRRRRRGGRGRGRGGGNRED